MKILISAFVCSPGMGSEAGRWRWVRGFAEAGVKVTLLTQTRFKAAIEAELAKDQFSNLPLDVIYFDLPEYLGWNKLRAVQKKIHPKLERLAWYLWDRVYYYLWQYRAYRFIKQEISIHTVTYDLVLHMTYSAITRVTFMHWLPIPFAGGPFGGGECGVKSLDSTFPFQNRLIEKLRRFYIFLCKHGPHTRLMIRNADALFVKTNDTMNMIGTKHRLKSHILSEMIIDDDIDIRPRETGRNSDTEIKLLFVGRFLYWKGIDLGIRAFARYLSAKPNASLTLVGKGPEKSRWIALAQQLNVADKLKWVDWVSKDELNAVYDEHDIFLFPSLHDSGGNVVLEALSHSLPVVCLNAGGPPNIIDTTCGIAIDVDNADGDTVADRIADALLEISNTSFTLEKYQANAMLRAEEFRTKTVIRKTVAMLEAI